VSVHRYAWRVVSDAQLAQYVTGPAAVVGVTAFFADIDLADDGDLADLTAYMASLGFVFVSTDPVVPI
jgi:hydrogenase maturation factor HypE